MAVLAVIPAAVALAGPSDLPAPLPNTEATPHASPNAQWLVVGGAKFGGDGEAFDASPAPATVDFHGTAFSPPLPGDARGRGGDEGFFVGARCEDEGTAFNDLETCARVPVAYRYRTTTAGDHVITRDELHELAGEGFVAAVAWIGPGEALAVGGTGRYPRRERPAVTPAPGQSYDDAYAADDALHGAGTARVWHYRDGTWQEVTNLPEGMSALTSVACSPTGDGRCVAGGMRQLWWWHPETPDKPEGFDTIPVTNIPAGVSVGASTTPAPGTSDFHYRVRAVRFNDDGTRVVALTSGCCGAPAGDAANPRTSAARMLTYDQFGGWTSQPVTTDSGEDAAAAGKTLPDSYYALTLFGGQVVGLASPGTPDGSAVAEPGSRLIIRGDLGTPVDSIKAVNGQVEPDQLDLKLDSLRLLAADGDQAMTPTAVDHYDHLGQNPDHIPDWLVGRFKNSAEGVAYTTNAAIATVPNPLTCSINDSVEAFDSNNPPNCDVALSNVSRGADVGSRRLASMGTYALNAITFVPGSNTAWAAGDRGALAELGGGGLLGAQNEPEAAVVGQPAPSLLDDVDLFGGFSPPAAPPGIVPALINQPVTQLREPALASWGTADPTRFYLLPQERVAAIAMSRDGSEGWAVGSGNPHEPGARGDSLTLQHFDGESWVRCNVEGIGDAIASSPVCSSLAPLLHAKRPTGEDNPPGLTAIARIPVERDSDPSNDDEFEAIAVGSERWIDGKPGSTIVNYDHGRWTIDEQASKTVKIGNQTAAASVTFRRPDDGWLTTSDDLGNFSLYHYGGGDWPHGRWVECVGAAGPQTECGGAVTSIPLGTQAYNVRVQVAGDTVFLAGTRIAGTSSGRAQQLYPFAMSLAPGGPWKFELDPGCTAAGTCPSGDPSAAQAQNGALYAFSVTDLGDGHVGGWILGSFGRTANGSIGDEQDYVDAARSARGPTSVLIRRDPDSGTWSYRHVADAADEYLPFVNPTPNAIRTYPSPGLVSYRDRSGSERAVILPPHSGNTGTHPPLQWDARGDRWRVLPAPFSSRPSLTWDERMTQGVVAAGAPDEQGGLWLVARQDASEGTSDVANGPHKASLFYRLSDRTHEPVFSDVANPVAAPITGLAGTPDGDVWVSTHSDRLYHYGRLSGWRAVSIKGWDRGRIVTNPSSSLAVAVNAAGVGVATGEQGRIADIGPNRVQLDPASGRRCSESPPPCGTPQDLDAAAVAPDGSAMVGGDHITLMWRPAGSDFRLIARPRTSPDAQITGISMPQPDRAWLTIDNGEIWRGALSGGTWLWVRESAAAAAADERGHARLNAVAVDPGGRGLAVGARGAMLERALDGTWTRLDSGYLDDLYSIALPAPGYGDGTVVGGAMGLITTRIDGHFHTARRADMFDPLTDSQGQSKSARIVGLAVAGGTSGGDVEAWAASQAVEGGWQASRRPPPFALLHYGSGSDPLLHPERRALPIADAPVSEPGEVAVAAFGRTECQIQRYCPDFGGTNLFNEIITRRITTEIERRRSDGSALMAVFTGDMTGAPGRDQKFKRSDFVPVPNLPSDPNVQHERWSDFVAEPLMSRGIPLFAALGRNDLSRASARAVDGDPTDTQQVSDAGLSLQWRQAFAGMPAPWGGGGPFDGGAVRFVPVARPPAASAAATSVDGPAVEAPGAGARTHYAVDVELDGRRVARLVVLDNSLGRSLATSDADQNPLGDEQASWLESVICIRGETCSSDAAGQREAGERAVVVTNAPTYSYGPGGLDATASDGSVLETLLMRHRASAVISGRLGWNGLYYTEASSLHSPCPGEAYPAAPPARDAAPCGAAASSTPAAPRTPAAGSRAPAAGELADALRGLGTPLPPQAEGAAGTADALTGTIPNIIAASAGGRFGPTGTDDGEARDGFWHGYTVLRLQPGGATIVEQRPIFDWVGLGASTHSLRPRQRLPLRGYGREPLGTDTGVRFDAIDSAAITHRYDLIEADPERPYLPRITPSLSDDADHPHGYTYLDPSVATVNAQTGVITAGSGNHGRVYALATLSVGEHVATYPMVFEPRRSYVAPRPVSIQTPAVPAIRTLAFDAHSITPPTAGTPAPPPPPVSTSLQVPAPPALPSLPSPGTPSSTPPVPPAPPTPPASQVSAPLNLAITPVGVSVPPTTGVTAQPTPPVNPSPPGGARKEAKQRQAATAKSEEGGGDQGVNPSDAQTRVNPVDSPNAYRRPSDPMSGRHAFTALRSEASPWTDPVAIGGGLTLMALALAFSFTGVRPTPRRRPPDVPAPAWSRSRRTR